MNTIGHPLGIPSTQVPPAFSGDLVKASESTLPADAKEAQK